MWVEIDGTDDFQEGAAGTARLIRRFMTDRGQGVANANKNGYIKGASITYEGTSGAAFYLAISHIGVRAQSGLDLVVVTYTTPGGLSVRQRGGDFNDGRIRSDGEEEWSFEGDLEERPAAQAFNYTGTQWTSQANWGKTVDDLVYQPGCILVWRKWFSKDTSAPNSAPIVLPNTKAKALNAVKTYLPDQNGTYENGSPPRLMYKLSATGVGALFLCVGVRIEADGDLVCRIAQFKYNPAGWSSDIYGSP